MASEEQTKENGKQEERDESPLAGLHAGEAGIRVAISRLNQALDAARKDLQPAKALRHIRSAAAAMQGAVRNFEEVDALLAGKTLPVPPGDDEAECIFRRDFCRALMSSPSGYSQQTVSGRESALYEGGSDTSLVGVVTPPAGYEYRRAPTEEERKVWHARTVHVAQMMTGVHVPADGIRAPWAPGAFRVPGIVRDVQAPVASPLSSGQ